MRMAPKVLAGMAMNNATDHRDGVADVVDQHARQRALDISQSFIVRAPAGSGKTRLLIQRYLALLATVDEPEEVIAITFTRKAAAEMRARVLAALAPVTPDSAASVSAATLTSDRDTQALAKRVLARDTERGWQLLASASRLRIQTIDAMNTVLTRQMPMLSRFGAQPESVDDAAPLYHRAAHNLLAQINDADGVADDLTILLAHLDNNLMVVEKLLADMLRSRDHWLRNLPKMYERQVLEAALARVRAHAIVNVAARYPPQEKTETLELARYAGQNLLKAGADSALSIGANLQAFPNGDASNLPVWSGIAEMLLTKDGAWRKRGGINKRNGFPVGEGKAEKARLDAMKERIGLLIESLSSNDQTSGVFAEKLHQLRSLPPASYTDNEWMVLGAIVRLLPYATAHLWNVFGAEGACDFTEIAQAASRALGGDGGDGDDDAPTDLALALDYRIRHLLVDEFQDTSFAQFELLEKLTRGWSEEDGRTLFVVGDPMQSIYRFREAEVGLFLRARQSGIGQVPLTALTLRVNFRSEPGVVAWVNNTFQQLMPVQEDISSGVVPYADSIAFAEQGEEGGARTAAVTMHWNIVQKPLMGDDDPPPATDHAEREAAIVLTIIQQTRTQTPDASIAILIRNRGHLRAIVPALKVANIAFQAVEIDPLKDRPVVQDLLAITRAISHLADRIAWLAILRAPWCGLTLNDLAALTNSIAPLDGELRPDVRPIWEIIHDVTRLQTLSTDGRSRLATLRNVLAVALATRRQNPLRDAVEQCWLALNGPACLPIETATSDLHDAMTFLDLLEAEAHVQSGGTQIVNLDALTTRMDRLFSGGRSNDADAPVQIMTIHKAKGLEFDTVIVPGLDRPPRNDDKKLLVWTEQPNSDTGERELLLAPIRETGTDDDADGDAIYQFVRWLDRAKQQHEDVRLLYVAATRAERCLHLLATITVKEKDGVMAIINPKPASLLASLWPAVEASAVAAMDEGAAKAAATTTTTNNVPTRPLNVMTAAINSTAAVPCRISGDFVLPLMPPPISHQASNTAEGSKAINTTIDFEWASDVARHIGSVVHLFLQRFAEDGISTWNAGRISQCQTLFAKELSQWGVANSDLTDAAARITAALIQTLEDPRGQWILKDHQQARSEWRLTGVVDNKLRNIAIDRTFVDDDGTRWIIDFKTGSHLGADAETFLDNEQNRYREQLETYAVLMHAMMPPDEVQPIKLGLYFPLLRGWREWAASG